jgi:hypothetical protein
MLCRLLFLLRVARYKAREGVPATKRRHAVAAARETKSNEFSKPLGRRFSFFGELRPAVSGIESENGYGDAPQSGAGLHTFAPGA